MSTGSNRSGQANRLATEASPYLLQHAHNPVDWWPWSEEALAEAKKRDVPILLSIGYSACHWCHVMERESFEDATIAGLMNALFVNIKVDREERPDLDQIYQLVVQLMGRSGGWPLTVFLTPSQKPFFAGTYFPPEDRYGMLGFPKVLHAISEAYRERREEVEGQADELTRAIASVGHRATDVEDETSVLDPDLLERTSRLLLQRVDPVHGGFGRAPKFPNTMPLEVLMRRGFFEADTASASAARLALESMRRGGIWDQLGGGFHRYSTDERWLVPHFEKMLYDNALLLRSYVDAYRADGAPLFSDTAKQILAYVAREMTDPEGGLYTSQDADSEGGEGTFFVWDESDVSSAIRTETEGAPRDGQPSDDDDALAVRVAVEYFGITPAGNFEEHGRPTFKTVLHEARPLRAVAEKLGVSEKDAREALERATRAMFEARSKRPTPFRDEKILSGVSSLMIGAMAEAGMALGIPEAVAAAARAFDFVVSKLVVRDAASVRALRLAKNVGGEWLVKGPGFLDDHAYLANAALDLYEATGDPDKVHLARGLVDTILAVFGSEDEGLFFTPKDGEALIVRSKDSFDHAVPSGAAMAIRALSRLGSLVSDVYRQRAEAELERLVPAALENPFGFGQVICEADRVVRGSTDVVLVGPRGHRATQELARAAFSVWLPQRTIAWVDPYDPSSRDACALLAEGKPAGDGPVAFVCRGRTCSLPVRTPEELRGLLRPPGIPEAVGAT